MSVPLIWRRALVTGVVAILIASLNAVTTMGAGEPIKNPSTVVELQFGDVVTLDPATSYDIYSSEPIWPNVYETLIMYSGSSLDKFQPMLATEVPSLANGLISPDGLTYTFPVRKGVHFHDGSTMTPDDAVYTIQRAMLQDQAGGPAWLFLSPLLGVDSTRDANGKFQVTYADVARAVSVKGDAVVFRLKKPFAPFLTIVAAWSFVMPKAWAAAHGDWDGNPTTWQKYNNPKMEDRYQFDHMNGTGPFKLERWDRQARRLLAGSRGVAARRDPVGAGVHDAPAAAPAGRRGPGRGGAESSVPAPGHPGHRGAGQPAADRRADPAVQLQDRHPGQPRRRLGEARRRGDPAGLLRRHPRAPRVRLRL